jgi:hypothetical protein
LVIQHAQRAKYGNHYDTKQYQDGIYLAIVTDVLDNDYFRLYVGQSMHLFTRIGEHIRHVLWGSLETLFYYICSKASRCVQFIRLGYIDSPDGPDREHIKLCLIMNIQEMVMCGVFGSLNSETLTVYFGEALGGGYSNVGLNVVPPLLQGGSLSHGPRGLYRGLLLNSPDPEIASWPHYRGSHLNTESSNPWEATPRKPRAQLEKHEYYSLVAELCTRSGFTLPSADALHKDRGTQSFDIASEVEYIEQDLGCPKALLRPYGSVEAKIGFVRDFGMAEVDADNLLPWGLTQMGFNRSNSLTWIFDFKQMRHQGICDEKKHSEKISYLTERMLRASNVTVVLMCGTRAEHSLTQHPALKLHGPVTRDLNGIDFRFWFELNGSLVKRVYVPSPDPLTVQLSNCWQHANRITEAIRLATCLTGTLGIRHYFFEARSVFSNLFRQAQEENNGGKRMTMETIDPSIYAWLHRKGFTRDEDIKKLESPIRSLTTGILVFLNIRSRFDRRPKHIMLDLEPTPEAHRRKKKSKIKKFAAGDICEVINILKDMPTMAGFHRMIKVALEVSNPIVEEDEPRLYPRPSYDSYRYDHGKPNKIRNEFLRGGHIFRGGFAVGTHYVKVHNLFVPIPVDSHGSIAIKAALAHPGKTPEYPLLDDTHPGLDPDDPARRLALHYTAINENDVVVSGWATVKTIWQAIYKVNTIVDWLDGRPVEEIAKSPRRHIRLMGTQLPEELQPFQGWSGMYTSTPLGISQKERISKKPLSEIERLLEDEAVAENEAVGEDEVLFEDEGISDDLYLW